MKTSVLFAAAVALLAPVLADKPKLNKYASMDDW
jgi:hypothetical protein